MRIFNFMGYTFHEIKLSKTSRKYNKIVPNHLTDSVYVKLQFIANYLI